MSSAATGHTNRLTHALSPYLRQHASNPVDWYPWGEEALERAKREHKPILLSIGYSACHWCHVMAHESFEDEATARLMNDYFVNIKVDREERPDLDQLYQGVVQLMGRGGGWPLTVFLTPDLRPFFGGTYFPPTDRYGIPAFSKLLEGLYQAWLKQPEDIEAQAQQFKEGLAFLGAYGLDAASAEPTGDDLVRAARKLEGEIDRVNGGFGRAPKFPNPMNVAMLLRAYRRAKDEQLISAAELTLQKMALGGIFDQLGGGFHRYSVDERWLVPHFEKMLYDNAQLIHLYAEAFQLTPRPLYRKVVEETVAYLEREMRDARGAFYASQDADSEGEEGKFFVWRPEEVDAALPPELARLIRARFGVKPGGNFEHGATVLEVVQDLDALSRAFGLDEGDAQAQLDQARAVLLEARGKRVWPGRDDKILTGWNGLTIRGLAFAARVFDQPRWAQLAAGAADFLLERAWDGKRLLRCTFGERSEIDAFLEDYGDFAAGLTALYQATFEPRYLEAAAAIVDVARARFWDEGKAAYLSAPRGQKDLIHSIYAVHDNATPSGASTLLEAQVTLAALLGRPEYLEQAGQYARKLCEQAKRNPFGHGHWWLAVDAYLDGAAEVTLIGSAQEVRPFLDALNRTFAPTTAVLQHDPNRPKPTLMAAALEGREKVADQPTAYLCRRMACEAPVTDAQALLRQLQA